MVKDLNRVRALIENDIRSHKYIDMALVLLCGEPLPFDIVLEDQLGQKRVFTIPSFNFYDIQIAEDESIYIEFNMYEIERDGKVIYCYRDGNFTKVSKKISNDHDLGSKVRVMKDRVEV